MEEIRKIKEINSTFSSKALNQNIQDIIWVKQKLTQTRTEHQRNLNETAKLKDQITQVNHSITKLNIINKLKPKTINNRS